MSTAVLVAGPVLALAEAAAVADSVAPRALTGRFSAAVGARLKKKGKKRKRAMKIQHLLVMHKIKDKFAIKITFWLFWVHLTFKHKLSLNNMIQ